MELDWVRKMVGCEFHGASSISRVFTCIAALWECCVARVDLGRLGEFRSRQRACRSRRRACSIGNGWSDRITVSPFNLHLFRLHLLVFIE
jgi:hypothetical protein